MNADGDSVYASASFEFSRSMSPTASRNSRQSFQSRRSRRAFKECRRAGFSLIESVLALALFAFAAVVIEQICYNCIYPLDIKDKNSTDDAALDRAAQAILGISSYDELDDGIEVKNVDGQTYRVYGYAQPTQIIDLFELEIVANGDGRELRRKAYVIRPAWYENTNDRQNLLEDRTDFLDEKRRAVAAEARQ